MDVVLPSIAGASGLIAAGIFALKKIRPHFPVTVNCWFCNNNSKVPFRRKNNFVCSSCHQYNGFNEDGDYNIDHPEQYCENLNSPPTRRLPSADAAKDSDTPGLSLGNGLCQTCNLYQAMKIKALAEFEPSCPEKFDEEVEIYEQRLERLYGGLCRLCSSTLKCTLGDQDSWLKPKLIHWRLQQSTFIKDLLTPLHARSSHRKHIISVLLRILCVLITVALATSCFFCGDGIASTQLETDEQTLPMTGGDGSISSSSIPDRTVNSQESSAHEEKNGNNTLDAGQPFNLVSWLQHHATPALQRTSSVLAQRESGAALLLLTMMLLAVAVAGRTALKVWDAAGCLLLVLLLASCSCQHTLLQVVLPSQLLWIKVVTSGLASCAVLFSVLRHSAPPASTHPRVAATRQNRIALDTSQDSFLSNSSLDSSAAFLPDEECLPDTSSSVTGTFSSAQISTGPPSLVSSNNPSVVPLPFSSLVAPLQFSASVVPPPFSSLNSFPNCGNSSHPTASFSNGFLQHQKQMENAHTMRNSVPNNPFSMNNQILESNNASKTPLGMFSAGGLRNINSNNTHNGFGPSNNRFTLTRSALGDTLNTSLGGLQIGGNNGTNSVQQRAMVPNGSIHNSMVPNTPRDAFIQRSADMNGMTLRSAAAGGSRLAQNINGIAQSSWVAGGYWGSPNKKNRSPSSSSSVNGGFGGGGGLRPMHQQQIPQQPPPPHLARAGNHNPVDEDAMFPLSRASSQSSGFVSHGSGSQNANVVDAGGNPGARNGIINNNNMMNENDHASVNSEPGFVWNYESCETSSQGSQNLDDEIDPTVLRHRRNVASNNILQNEDDVRSIDSGATTAISASQYSSAAASSSFFNQQNHPMQHMWSSNQTPQQRNPYQDMQSMRALSRLSQHEISDDDLSMLSQRSIEVVTKTEASGGTRNPWVAFILGMSVMANGVLALVLYKNGTLAELLSI